MSDIAPEWATREFCKRANLIFDRVLVADGDHGVVLRSAVRAGALLIAEHEEPPVDPLKDAWTAAQDCADAEHWEQALATRGIKIGKSDA